MKKANSAPKIIRSATMNVRIAGVARDAAAWCVGVTRSARDRAAGLLALQARDRLEQVDGHQQDVEKPDQELDPEVQRALAREQPALEERHQQLEQETHACPDRVPAH